MNENEAKHSVEARLDRAVAQARDDVPEAGAAEAAGERVWAALEAGTGSARPLAVCADYQALLPDYAAGGLRSSQRSLVEDHLRGCADCRRALQAERGAGAEAGPRLVTAPPARRRSRVRGVVWAAAAAVLLAVGLAGGSVLGLLPFGPDPVLAQVESVEGDLYRVAEDGMTPVSPGGEIRAGTTVRSAEGARALLRLADGSLVEVGDRSGLRLDRRLGRTAVSLERGRVIVRAAESDRPALAVSTSDCVATVRGTVFAVSHGLAGSRVSVLAGEVEVADARGETLLQPGDQLTTAAGVVPVDLRDEVSWSGDAEDYAELIAHLAAWQGDVRAAFLPGGRTDSRLLDIVPTDADAVLAMPNVAVALADSQAALDERLAESDAFRAWWQQAVGPSGAGDEMRAAVDRLSALGGGLGDEILVAARMSFGDEPPEAVLLSELRDEAGFEAALAAEMRRARAEGGADLPLAIVEDAAALAAGDAAASDAELLLWRGEGLVVAATDPALLRAAAVAAEAGGSGFRETSFGTRIAAAYARGIDWLVAADLDEGLDKAVAESGAPDEAAASLSMTGLDGARYLVAGQTGGPDGPRTEATLSFDGPRQGMAAWLSAPAPIGALRFVSADATAAAAFVVADPAVMLDDLFRLADAAEPGALEEARAAEGGEMIAALEALAAALGGDVAVAIDGPLLPEPSTVLAMEVYDPDALLAALGYVVALQGRYAGESDAPAWTLAVDGPGFVLETGREGKAVHGRVVDGYLVAAPSAALVERAARTYRSGTSLADSEVVRDGVGLDGNLDVSALFYQDVGGALRDLTGGLADELGASGGDGAVALETLRSMAPTLLTLVATEDEVRLYGDGWTGLADMPLLDILGASAPAR